MIHPPGTILAVIQDVRVCSCSRLPECMSSERCIRDSSRNASFTVPTGSVITVIDNNPASCSTLILTGDTVATIFLYDLNPCSCRRIEL